MLRLSNRTNNQMCICRAAGPHEIFPLGLHQLMFTPHIQTQGNDKQVEKFVDKARNYEILGTYAQTELGHGNRTTTTSGTENNKTVTADEINYLD